MRNYMLSILFSTLLFAGQASADILITIQDSWMDWPGYTSQIPDTDAYGTPKIDHMDVTLDDAGILKNIDIILKDSTTWQTFNSLFINSYGVESSTTQWNDWDFFAHDGGAANTAHTIGNVPDDGLWKVKPNGYDYTMTDNEEGHRQDVPNGIDQDDLTDRYATAGWQRDSLDPYILSYSFEGIEGLEIDMSQGGFIAFSPWCANDVLGGEMNPVPEPATLALLGIGLIGLAGIVRKQTGEGKI